MILPLDSTPDPFAFTAELAADIKFGQRSVMPVSKPRQAKRKRFIAWDGEGSMDDRDTPQDYVLFGNSKLEYIQGRQLTTSECLEFMLQQAEKYPNEEYIHVGFAFDYDVNQILNSLPPQHFAQLAEKGVVFYKDYRIEHLSHKWIKVSDRRSTRRITIMDIWGFFQGSFVKAIKSYIPTHPLMAELTKIEEGKAQRMHFTYDNIEYIREYWTTEIQLLEALAEQLREYLESVEIDLGAQFHGPGAVASKIYKERGIKAHKSVSDDRVRRAAAFAYAGGRFELFRMGRHEGPVYGMDINSAYPHAIADLPSMSEGHWEHQYYPDPHAPLQEFALHYVKLNAPMALGTRPSPLFHRDSRGNITYPWRTEGWYWTPEVEHLQRMSWLKRHHFSIVESWSYVGWETRPFSEFVPEMYYQRQEMKRNGIGSEKALKLALNSLYGKMAQRAGWERKGGAPTWHQLEWAGFVTSRTRAQLYSILDKIPWNNLIGVETDGIYTTADPVSLGISDSKALGGWEVTTYDEIMYVQSGVYFYGTPDGNTGKYRGLDAGSLNFESMARYLQTLRAGEEWESLSGPTTRFIGYRAANHRFKNDGDELKRFHRRWITNQRDISPGLIGKRRHAPMACKSCAAGLSAFDAPHDMYVHSMAYKGEVKSTPHFIPWENWGGAEPDWREMEISIGDMLV